MEGAKYNTIRFTKSILRHLKRADQFEDPNVMRTANPVVHYGNISYALYQNDLIVSDVSVAQIGLLYTQLIIGIERDVRFAPKSTFDTRLIYIFYMSNCTAGRYSRGTNGLLPLSCLIPAPSTKVEVARSKQYILLSRAL